MTAEEKKIREILGPFTIKDPADVKKKKFDSKKFKELAVEVRKIYSDESNEAGNNNNE